MSTSKKARLYAFEGPDGVGKSTLVAAIANNLRSVGRDVVEGSFPGQGEGTLGKLVYELHHEPRRFGLSEIGPVSLQLLHVAAHIEAITGWITAARNRGAVILLDRLWWSTAVYASSAGVPKEEIEMILMPELEYWRRKPPDAVFLIDRIRASHARAKLSAHAMLTTAYDTLATAEAANTRVIRIQNDASILTVAAEVTSIIEAMSVD